MIIDIAQYKTVVFDCDGVILNSNQVKTQAFYNAALPYGTQSAQALVDYHVAHGGVSRYQKFRYFLEELVLPGVSGPGFQDLLDAYAAEVRKGLLSCEVASGLHDLRRLTADAHWLVISGGDQSELREIFALRELTELFDGGVFGSPDTKDHIFTREIQCGNIAAPAVFVGDSRCDFEAASKAGVDFVFVSAWSEWQGYEEQLDMFCGRVEHVGQLGQ
ncbi:HAD hydrolase-like protein [Desulfurispirillum indicum]|uniref:HAD family hydrolase n=1 Tax=Desulfurispirillum indicum TaxID=936456 RepID=UPI001CFB3390|nr:HAD hydrolase-like protein [Desulfurispirillum indicum]UCZ56944.1 HAD hydrolase-like protein [Desulfurispirillum indicum]